MRHGLKLAYQADASTLRGLGEEVELLANLPEFLAEYEDYRDTLAVYTNDPQRGRTDVPVQLVVT